MVFCDRGEHFESNECIGKDIHSESRCHLFQGPLQENEGSLL